MNAEIICVGTELLLGDIVNTHAPFLSQHLASLGINVYYQTVVGDNNARFTAVLKQALERSDLIVLTGGLGPTTDDLTKETAAALLGLELSLDETVAARLKDYFVRTGKPMTPNNLKQAMVPKGAHLLQNDWGTAPGLILEKGEKTLILLPGPPRELRPMFLTRVKPWLEQKTASTIRSCEVRIYGIGESELESRMEDLVQSTDPTVALYCKDGEVLVRVTAKAADEASALQKIDAMVDTLRDRFGTMVYGINQNSLQEVLVQLLLKRHQTIATAESCTGGMLASWITEISGSSAIFEMGAVTYANRIKEQLLGVSKETLDQYGAVSEQTAREMAEGLSKISGADFAVSITGIAGPTGGTEEKPVGTVYIGVAHRGKVWVTHNLFARSHAERQYIRKLSCLKALDMVRQTLLNPSIFEENYR